MHYDPRARISVVLSGVFFEETPYCSGRRQPLDTLFKSTRARHSTEFGESGARVLAVEPSEDTLDELDIGTERRLVSLACTESVSLAALLILAARANDRKAVETACIELLSLVRNALRERHKESRALRRLTEEARTAILDHPEQAHSLSGFARRAGVHPVYFARAFRSATRCSISLFMQLQRIRKSMVLMQNPALALGRIASEVGYYDQSHFSRHFRRLVGCAPGAFRRKLASQHGVSFVQDGNGRSV